MVQTPPKSITLDEFLQLPETQPASEYLNGQVIQKPMPKGKHSAIQTELSTSLNAALKSAKIARAFAELRCTFVGRSIVPDVSVFTWERIARDPDGSIANDVWQAPDWAIEILSPDQSQTKLIAKLLHCLDNGTALGWLIDPGDRCIFCYPLGHQPQLFTQPDQVLPVPAFVGDLIQLTVGTVFGWLDE